MTLYRIDDKNKELQVYYMGKWRAVDDNAAILRVAQSVCDYYNKVTPNSTVGKLGLKDI